MDRRRKEEMEMSDRHMIYELLEEAHQVNYPNYTFGSYLKAIDPEAAEEGKGKQRRS